MQLFTKKGKFLNARSGGHWMHFVTVSTSEKAKLKKNAAAATSESSKFLEFGGRCDVWGHTISQMSPSLRRMGTANFLNFNAIAHEKSKMS